MADIPSRPPSETPSAPYPAAVLQTANPKATASMVLGVIATCTICCSPLPILLGIPGIILGHLARSTIRKSNGTAAGAGPALAGLWLSYSAVAFAILFAGTYFIKDPSGYSNIDRHFSPGAGNFNKATEWVDGQVGKSRGNSAEGRRLAKSFFDELIAKNDIALAIDPEILTVWCEHRAGRCAFIVSYPEISPEEDGIGKVFLERCWITVQETLKDTGIPEDAELAIGFRGIFMYQSWVKGIHVKESPDSSSIQIYGKGEQDRPALYPFFSDR